MDKTKVMIVEDEVIIARDIERSLSNLHYEVLPLMTTGENAIEYALKELPDIILMDIVLTGNIDGIEAAQIIKNNIDVPIIFLTSYSDEHHISRAKQTEPFGYLLKPLEIKMIHSSIQMALYKHRTEIKLSQMNLFLSNIMETMADALIVTDQNKKITNVNQATIDLTGYNKDELESDSFIKLICKTGDKSPYINDCKNFFSILMEKNKIKNYELMFQNSLGEHIPVSISGSRLLDKFNNICGYVFIARDMRELKEAMAQLIHTENLSVIGEYASGIFHDIKNPLQLISMLCENIRFNISHKPVDINKIDSNLDDIIMEVRKTDHILNHMNIFTKMSKDCNIQKVNINNLIDTGLKYFSTQIVSNIISINKNLDESIPQISANPVMLEQILLNLLSNAMNALIKCDKSDKKITISTYNLNDWKSKTKKESIVLSVSDNADGIPKNIENKIFNKFFTTSQDGKGTGLGLAIVKRIVEENKGTIELDNEIGKGATFKIILPVLSNGL